MHRIFAPALLATALLVVGCAGAEPGTASSPPSATHDPSASDAAEPDVPPLHPEVDDWDAAVLTVTGADGDEVRIDARIAATSTQWQRGLMQVADLPDGVGMLFDFEDERSGGFWMKDTLVPLDIAFVGPDGVIRSILTMESCEADPCPVYEPEVTYASALEVPAGWFRAHGIAVGDRLSVGPVMSADVVSD